MNETSSGAFGGAASGATAGASVGGVPGAIVGAVVGGIGGALSGRAKSKAAKRKLKMMQQALRMYQAGSTDAFGNTLSANPSGRWSYNLSPATQASVVGANSAMREQGSYKPKSFSNIFNDNMFGTSYALNSTANNSQSNAMRRALQEGSNIGVISTAYNNNRMNKMRDSMYNAYQNATNYNNYNAQNRENLGKSAYYAQLPVNTIQANLQDMVNNLNKTEMEQMNSMAGAAADKTLAGRSTFADLLKYTGGAISGFGQNAQQQDNFNKILKLYKDYYNNNNVVSNTPQYLQQGNSFISTKTNNDLATNKLLEAILRYYNG